MKIISLLASSDGKHEFTSHLIILEVPAMLRHLGTQMLSILIKISTVKSELPAQITSHPMRRKSWISACRSFKRQSSNLKALRL